MMTIAPVRRLTFVVAVSIGSVFPCCIHAAYDDYYHGYGGRAAGMGGAYTALADDSSAVYWNPAGLANVPRTAISIMQGQGTLITGVIPLNRFALGVSRYAVSTGVSRYAVTLGVPMTNRLNIGGTLGYMNADRSDYGFTRLTAHGMLFNVGLMYSASDAWSLGVTHQPVTCLEVTQPVVMWWGETVDNIDAVVLPAKTGLGIGYRAGNFSAGAGYDYVAKVTVVNAVAIENDYPDSEQSTFKAGLEYALFKGNIPVRAGVNYSFAHEYPEHTSMLSESLGLGLKLGGFRFDGTLIFKHPLSDTRGQDWTTGNFSFGWVF